MSKEEKYFLVKWEGNWADEADFIGFTTMNEENWIQYKNRLEKHEESFEFSVGTNEEVEYENGKELLRDIRITEINENECDVINKIFGYYGHCQFTEF